MDNLAAAIMGVSQRLGVNPVDLGTAISYETGGTFDPWKKGPTTKWGEHRGLIQWGEPQRQQYGVRQDMPSSEQMLAVEKYLRDRGVKSGMGLMDIYSAINAGRVGLNNRSDARAGGAPGTVADKVNNQMGAHRAKAVAFLSSGAASPPVPTQAPVQLAMAESAPVVHPPQIPAQMVMARAAPMRRPEPEIVSDGPASGLAALFVMPQGPDPQQQAELAAAERRRREALFLDPYA